MSANKASVGVIISGILAILGSAFSILGVSIGLIGLYLTPQAEAGPMIPAYVKPIAFVSLLLFLGIAAFGVVTGIGLIRLKNWARISILAFSGITAFFGGTVLAFLLVMPFPMSPAGSPMDPGVVKGIVLLAYGLPVLISVGWLVLFNRKSTKAQFTGGLGGGLPATPAAPGCPLPVQIMAVFFLFSLLGVVVVPFVQLPVPLVIFGRPIYGAAGKALFGLASVLLGIGAIGLLRLKKWSYPLVLGMQGFWLLSGMVTAFTPTYPRLIQEMLSQMPIPGNVAFPYSVRQFQFCLLFSVLLIGILVFYRRRFMEAASARETLRPN